MPVQICIWTASCQNQQNDCAPSEDSVQPGHPPSLIRVFAVRSMDKDPVFLHADQDSDQTGRMPRRTGHFVGFVMRRLKYMSILLSLFMSIVITVERRKEQFSRIDSTNQNASLKIMNRTIRILHKSITKTLWSMQVISLVILYFYEKQ